jgi:hypothetical protein
VPFVGLFVLGLGMLVAAPSPWRPLVFLVLPLAALSSWAFVTRPHLSFNAGDGSWWLGNALAERFSATVRPLLPSFLSPTSATWAFPLAVAVVLVGLACSERRLHWLGRAARAGSVPLGLASLAVFCAVLVCRYDTVVELEDAQIAHRGGTIAPPAGTFSRFLVANGWRVKDGEGVVVPLRVPPGASARVVGWLDGESRSDVSLLVGWDGAPLRADGVVSDPRGGFRVPAPGAGARHRLELRLRAGVGVSAVLDRVVIDR